MSEPTAHLTASRAPAVAILVEPDREGMPLYTQLYRQLRQHILSGSFPAGARLPSARVMAADLRLSRNTVEAAIEQLCAEGFVSRRVGAGTTVLNVQESAPFLQRTRRVAAGTSRSAGRPEPRRNSKPGRQQESFGTPELQLSPLGWALQAGGQTELDADRHMGACTTDVSRFPNRTWNRLLAREARKQGRSLLHAGDLQGDRSLRETISEHARLTRGLRCTADQVVILSSTQQALDLAGRLLLAPGDIALVEEPGYLSARAVFTGTDAEVRGIPVDHDGLDTDRLREHQSARLLYLTPSHQFPLGVTLSLARRLAAIAWAHKHNAWIIEDDYDSEFRYLGRPIAALQGLDHGERVLYVGTFNKILFPGVRLAYVILPHALVNPFLCARRLTDGSSPPLLQAALASFLVAGHFAAHLRRARKFYESRRDVLMACLRDSCGDAIVFGVSDTGLHLTLHLPVGTDDHALANAGAGFGLGVAALSRYYVEWSDRSTVPRGLLLSYGGASETAIRNSVHAFAPMLRAHTLRPR